MLEDTGTKVSISTVKRVLYRHNLKGRSARKKQLHMGTKIVFFSLWSDETKIELFGHNDHCYVWEEKGGCLQAEEHHPNREARG